MFDFPNYRAHKLHPSVGLNKRVYSWWLERLPAGLSQTPRAGSSRVGNVKRYVDRHVKYKPDLVDEWQSPDATLAWGHGDCEDFAIAYYACLRHLDYGPEDMAVIAGNMLERRWGRKPRRIGHAVLFVQPLQLKNPMVLDNRCSKVRSALDYYSEFKPTFWVNEKGGGLYLPDPGARDVE